MAIAINLKFRQWGALEPTMSMACRKGTFCKPSSQESSLRLQEVGQAQKRRKLWRRRRKQTSAERGELWQRTGQCEPIYVPLHACGLAEVASASASSTAAAARPPGMWRLQRFPQPSMVEPLYKMKDGPHTKNNLWPLVQSGVLVGVLSPGKTNMFVAEGDITVCNVCVLTT
jgi:hypothetical protein